MYIYIIYVYTVIHIVMHIDIDIPHINTIIKAFVSYHKNPHVLSRLYHDIHTR